MEGRGTFRFGGGKPGECVNCRRGRRSRLPAMRFVVDKKPAEGESKVDSGEKTHGKAGQTSYPACKGREKKAT